MSECCIKDYLWSLWSWLVTFTQLKGNSNDDTYILRIHVSGPIRPPKIYSGKLFNILTETIYDKTVMNQSSYNKQVGSFSVCMRRQM